MPRRLIICAVAILALVLVVFTWLLPHQRRKHADPIDAPPGTTIQGTPPSIKFNKARYSLNEPASIWVVVNKQRALANSYKPSDLVVPNVPLRLAASSEQMHVRQEPARAMEDLFAGAKTAGFPMILASGFRSFDYQKGLYNGYVATDGQTAADRSSARPGHSEHQTGLAADLEPSDRSCELDACFGDSPQGKWLAEHAYEYGFIIRYQKGTEAITGYEYEPWHIRYVGKELAAEVHKTNQTLEEFFGLPAAPDYE